MQLQRVKSQGAGKPWLVIHFLRLDGLVYRNETIGRGFGEWMDIIGCQLCERGIIAIHQAEHFQFFRTIHIMEECLDFLTVIIKPSQKA